MIDRRSRLDDPALISCQPSSGRAAPQEAPDAARSLDDDVRGHSQGNADEPLATSAERGARHHCDPLLDEQTSSDVPGIPGCRDVVIDGVNGYLCAVRDAGSLASAMRRLLQLPRAQQLAMGEAGRRRVQERFSETLVIRSYLDVLASVERAAPGS